MRKGATIFAFDAAAIQEYVCCSPSVFRSESNNLLLAIADGGNNFTNFGIVEGTLLVFDGELSAEDGKLSMYADFSKPKQPMFKLSLNVVPGMNYVGRAIARVNYFES